MLEVGVVIARGHRVLFWHEPRVRSSVALPDSRDLWSVMWENRGDLLGFAHTHPGSGIPMPSSTDLSTFSAIELALGRRLQWWISTEDVISEVTVASPLGRRGGLGYLNHVLVDTQALSWLPELRERTFSPQPTDAGLVR